MKIQWHILPIYNQPGTLTYWEHNIYIYIHPRTIVHRLLSYRWPMKVDIYPLKIAIENMCLLVKHLV